MTAAPSDAPSRRGRPRAGDLAQRRADFLDIAAEVLVQGQPEPLTVQRVAQAAGTSKTTVYSWFEGLDGVYAALVTRQAGRVVAGWDPSAPRTAADLRTRLLRIATALLDMLTDEVSIALHRVAVQDAAVAAVVLERQRHQIGGLIQSLLEASGARGVLQISDPVQACEVFYGLVVADRQYRVMLGETRPTLTERQVLAVAAVDAFLLLHGPGGM